MIYGFDEFELDTAKVELRRSGSPIAVEPQVFSLLQLLVVNADRMIPRDEIIDKIWNGRFISEAAVASRISMARSSLGDDGKQQRYIKTIHGQGLRFVAEVQISSVQNADDGELDRAKSSHNFKLPDLHDKPTIAVLPFESMTGENKELIFSRGLTEEIISRLTQFRDFGVYSRSTTSKLAREGRKIPELRQELGVDFVVEGGILLRPDKVKVTVQLIDAATDIHVFAEQFERTASPNELFDIQDQIALLIAGRIANPYGSINRLMTDRSQSSASISWETYYQVARFYDYHATRDKELHPSLKQGLKDALDKDTHAAVGWAALALLYVDEYRFRFHPEPKPELLTEALEYANKAISCDGENSFAFLARALSHYYSRRFDDFEIAAEQCVFLNPGHAHNLAEIAFCYCLTSKFEKAVPLADRAIQLSPVHPGWFRLTKASHYLMNDDPKAAIIELKKAPMKGYFWYHAYMLNYCAHADDQVLLEEQIAIIAELYPDFATRVFLEAEIWCVDGAMPLKMLKGWHKAGIDVYYPEKYAHLDRTKDQ